MPFSNFLFLQSETSKNEKNEHSEVVVATGTIYHVLNDECHSLGH
jgi:hypothetical protein